jgi:SAM-dependent methyltransferase
VKAYYDRRAPDYDEWYLGLRRFRGLDRPDWENELQSLIATLVALPPAVTLDVACGTGFLTQYLPGFTAHFCRHLDSHERARFLTEARRVAGELVIVDSAIRPGLEPESVEERTLQDGSRWTVLKRYFTPEGLAAEVGGGRTMHGGRWFVAVAA